MSSIWQKTIQCAEKVEEANVGCASCAPPVPARKTTSVPTASASIIPEEGVLGTVKKYFPSLPSFFGDSAAPIESPHTEKTPLLRSKNGRS